MKGKGWVTIIGPGAVGGVLAASLSKAGFEVRLAARQGGEAGRLARAGLRFTGPDGRSRLVRGLKALGAAPRPDGPCAAVFLCVKARDLASALPAARAAGGPDTPVVSLLNGVGHERAVRRAVGARRAVLGSCYFAAMRVGPRAVRHAGGTLVWLAQGPANRAAARRAADVLRAAGWHVAVKADEARLLWTKLVYNAGVNPLAALARRPNGALASDGALRELTLRALGEARRAAAAAGRRPYPEMTDAKVLAGCRAVPDQLNSMIQDLDAGRPTEAGAILTPLLTAARRGRVPVPSLSVLAAALAGLEEAPA
jgi:2-dehydropantoate 2-reductase